MRAAARSLPHRSQKPDRVSPIATPPGPPSTRRKLGRVLSAARDPFHTALLVLVVLDVSRIHQQFGFLKAMRPALVMTGVVAVLAFLRPGSLSKRPLLETWPAKGIAAFFVLACCSAIFGISFGNSALFILNVYGKTVVFAFLIIAGVRSARDLYAIVWAYVLSTGWIAYTSMFVFHLHNYGNYSRLSNMDTYDANDVGLVLLVGLALTLLVFQTAKPLGKAACGFLLVGIGASLAKTGSRGAFVGLLALGLALLLLADRVSIAKRLSFVAILGFAMVLFAPAGYWNQMRTIEDPQSDYNWKTVNGRKAVAERGLGYMMAYPIFGVGINNFSKAECFISDKAKNHTLGSGIRCTPPHNAYIEAAAETGIPGGLLWIALVPGSVVWLIGLRRRIPRRWATGDAEERFLYLATMYGAVMLASYSVGSFFLSFTWYEISYYIFAFLAGLSVAIREKQRRTMALAPPNDIVAGYGR
jgi:O-antigen ligase